MANINYPYRFQGRKRAVASQVNANFDEVKSFANGVNAEITALQKAIGSLEEKPTREMFDVYFSFKGETPTGAYPLWTGETITNCKILYPDFWKELNRLASNKTVPTVESSAAFDDMVEEYGQCPCFYIDTLNGHVRLPKITRFISSITQLQQLGTAAKDQIKSHTHGLPGANSACAGGGRALYLFGASDAPAKDNYRTSSASGSGETYPKHVKLALYLQVVNNTADISRFDIDALKKELEAALLELQTEFEKYQTELLSEFEKIKDKIAEVAQIYKFSNVNVPVAAFVADGVYSDYPFKAEIEFPVISSSFVPTVVFSVTDAESGNYAPVAETGDGFVRIWAKKVPETDLIIPTIMCQ